MASKVIEVTEFNSEAVFSSEVVWPQLKARAHRDMGIVFFVASRSMDNIKLILAPLLPLPSSFCTSMTRVWAVQIHKLIAVI